jgi:hypothetical protein
MSISIEAANFVSELSSDELEIFCGIDLGKDDQALSLRLTALLTMIERLDTGSADAAVDKAKADKLRTSAKKMIDENPFLPTSAENEEFLVPTEEKRFFTSDMIYTGSIYYTRLRLFIHRLNKVFGKFSRFFKNGNGFLPLSYPITGIIGGIIELFGDLFVILKSTFSSASNKKTDEQLSRWQQFKVSFLHAKDQATAYAQEKLKQLQQQAEKWPRWRRFVNVLWKGNRIVRMINAFVWPVLNFVCFITIPAMAIAGTITTAYATFLIAALTIGGTVMDIVLDTGSALYACLTHFRLLKKLNKLDGIIDALTLKKAKAEVWQKLKDLLVTKALRLFNYNAVLCIAMILMLGQLTPLVAVIWLSAAFAAALTDLANFAKGSTFEKVRTVLTLVLIAATIAASATLIMSPFIFTLPFIGLAELSIPMIGAALALTVGSLGFARAVAFSDASWRQEKWTIFKEKCLQPIGNFFSRILTATQPQTTLVPQSTSKQISQSLLKSRSAISRAQSTDLDSESDEEVSIEDLRMVAHTSTSTVRSPEINRKMAAFAMPRLLIRSDTSPSEFDTKAKLNQSTPPDTKGQIPRIKSVPNLTRHSSPVPPLSLHKIKAPLATISDAQEKSSPDRIASASPAQAFEILGESKKRRESDPLSPSKLIDRKLIGTIFAPKSLTPRDPSPMKADVRPRSYSASPRKMRAGRGDESSARPSNS